jgi:hypothetical protein
MVQPLRTVAQSVLTLNFESGVSVPELFMRPRGGAVVFQS